MLTPTLKMGTLLKFLVYVLMVSGKMDIVGSTLESTENTVLKFSKCMIDKMSESELFTSEDREIMIDVQDIMAQSLSVKSKRPISPKVLVGTFISSLADVIITDDAVKNTYRKGMYTLALEKCSSFSTEYMDINEAQRILATIERNKASKYKPGVSSGAQIPAAGNFKSISFSGTSGVNKPYVIQPFPVQNTFVSQDFNSNDKTIFKQQEKPYIPSLSPTNAQYETQTEKQIDLFSNFGTDMQKKPGNFPVQNSFISQDFNSNDKTIFKQQEKHIPSLSPTNAQYETQTEKEIGLFSNFGADVQRKPENFPLQNSFISQNFNSNDKTIFKQQERPYIPSLSPKNEQYEAQTEKQIGVFSNFGADMQKQPENFQQQPNIAQTTILYSSNTPSLQQENFASSSEASGLLKSEKGLLDSHSKKMPSNYDIDKIYINKIRSDSTTVPSYTETSHSILKNEGDNFQTTNGGLSIPQTKESSVIVIPLPDNKQFTPDKHLPQISQQANEEEFYMPSNEELAEIDYTERDIKETDFDFQSPPLAPENRKNEIFSLELARYLSNSETIKEFFCGDSDFDDKVQISFSIIKASLIEYGQHVKALAASVASGALSELSEVGLCYNYAKTISESVSEILERNGIDKANPESISLKMEADLNQRLLATISDNFPTRVQEAESYTAVPQVESSFESVEEISPNHQAKTEYPNQVVSDSKNAFDLEYTDSTTLSDESTCPSTVEITEDSYDSSTPDDIIGQKAFADYLTDVLESVLKIFDSKDEDYEENNSGTEETKNSNVKINPVELQPSFKDPNTNSELKPNNIMSPNSDNSDRSTEFAKKVSEIAESSVAYIRSPNFNLNNLCSQINQLAKLVDIPSLNYCEPIAAIDYLLNVLTATVKILK